MPDGWGLGGAITPGRVTPEDVATVLDDLLTTTPRLIVKPGYLSGGAWVGHFFFEKNKPATFDYPLYSFRADWIMYWQMLTGKLSW